MKRDINKRQLPLFILLFYCQSSKNAHEDAHSGGMGIVLQGSTENNITHCHLQNNVVCDVQFTFNVSSNSVFFHKIFH